ncbi:MAG: class I SAM-dependent methyltransferase [Alphaproteobacteria bacterium]|nr:class I SAM-dependent methyltransferase [Alphaproteobacteria bacterium]
MIEAFGTARRFDAIAEVGVARGDFSQSLIDTLAPKIFHAIDRFRLHEMDRLWGMPSSHYFEGLTQRAYFERRFAGAAVPVIVHEGDSAAMIAGLPQGSIDLFYIDAAHDAASVAADAAAAASAAAPDGVLIFNDYTLHDPYSGDAYGVVEAVNTLVTTSAWRVIGLSLQRDMFCDIALARG